MSFPRYPAYKPSGVEWLGEVPEHWEALRLRFAVTLNPSKQEAKELGDQEVVSFLPMEAIGEDGSLRLEHEKQIAECLSGYTYFRDGDVCLAKITPCFENGKSAILHELKGGLGFGTTELIIARPHKDKVTSDFLDYLFRSQIFRRLGESEMYGAGGQKRVPDSFVRDFAAALPSIEEQSQVTTFLNHETAKIDALIAEQQRLIELLQEKRQAVISHAVTKGLNPNAPMKDSGVEWLGEVPEHWDVRKISQLFVGIGSGTTPKSDEIEYYEDGDIPWVVTGDLNDELLESCSNFITKKAMQAHTTLRLYPKGSVAVAMYGATIGKTSLLGLEATVNQACCVLPPSTKVNENFLLHFLISAKNHLISLATGGGQPNINQDIVRSLRIPLPEVKEQIEIFKHLSKILVELESLLGLSNRQVLLLLERRSALISAAVTGQIDVRGLAEPEAGEQ